MVSVIIPNYNAAKWLEQTISSCLEQGKLLSEIIVVDDGSDDNSLDILSSLQSKHPSIIKILKNKGKGGNLARVIGFEESTGSYIQWLDADDQILPGKFEKQVGVLENNAVDVVLSDWRIDHYEGEKLIRSEPRKNHESEDFLLDILLNIWSSPNTYLMTREAASKTIQANGWNPERRIGQDREFFTMAAIIGLRFKYIPGEFAVYNRWNEQSVSQQSFKDRLILDVELEHRFKEELRSRFTFPEVKKYVYTMHTHRLKAIFYNMKIHLDESFSLFHLHWHIVHPKMRLVLPFIYVWKWIEMKSLK